MDDFTQEDLAAAFADNRQGLLALAERRLNPILRKRMSAEDVVADAYARATQRLGYFAARDDVPVASKLRTILLQSIVDVERRHLQVQRRDVYRELTIRGEASEADGGVRAADLAADITSPVSRADKDERHALLRRTLSALPGNDRRILELRHFEGLGNAACAAALGLTEKAASVRYVRALKRSHHKLMEVLCFRES